jgi:hypothetical protein
VLNAEDQHGKRKQPAAEENESVRVDVPGLLAGTPGGQNAGEQECRGTDRQSFEGLSPLIAMPQYRVGVEPVEKHGAKDEQEAN